EGHLKLGLNRLSGDTMRMRSAASATLRMVSAGRSSSTAMSTMLIMIQERTVGTAAPDAGDRTRRRRARRPPPICGWKAQRDGWDQREPRPDQPEHGAGHNHHMQAGDRQDVEQA